MNSTLFGLVLCSVLFSTAGQLLLRFGAKQSGQLAGAEDFLQLILSPAVILGICAWGLSTLFWLIALTRAELSLIYSLTALNYVLVPVAANLLFRESLDRPRIIGMTLVFLGVMTILLGPQIAASKSTSDSTTSAPE